MLVVQNGKSGAVTWEDAVPGTCKSDWPSNCDSGPPPPLTWCCLSKVYLHLGIRAFFVACSDNVSCFMVCRAFV